MQRLIDQAIADPTTDGTLEKFSAAIKLAKDVGDDAGWAIAEYGVGYCWQDKGDLPRAVSFYEAAWPVQRRIGDKKGEADSLLYLGVCDNMLGKVPNAIRVLKRSADLYHSLGQISGEATVLVNLGGSCYRLGTDAQALRFFQRAESLALAAKDIPTRINALTQEAQVYMAIGQNARGQASASKALALCDKNTPGDLVGITLATVATACRNTGRTREALGYMERASRIQHTLGNSADEAEMLVGVAVAEAKLGLHASAIRDLRSAYSMYSVMHNPTLEAEMLHKLGDEYGGFGAEAKAQSYYLLASRLWRQNGDRQNEALCLARIAQIDLAGGRPRTAIWRFKMAVNIYQLIRKGLTGLDKNARDTYRDKFAFIYHDLADALIADGRLSEAEEVIRLLKDEEYYSLIRGSRKATEVDLTPVEYGWSTKYELVTAEAINAERAIEAEQAKGEKADQDKLAALRAKLQDANDAVSKFLTSAENAFESSGASTDRLNDLKGSREVVSVLHQPSLRTYRPAAVYTLMTKDGVRMILALPDTRVMQSAGTKVDAERLKRMILDFRSALMDPHVDPRPMGSQLYEILVRPIESTLNGTHTKTLLWSLDGALRYIPMWALYDNRTGEYLIEEYPSAVFMPAMTERMSREPGQDWAGSTFACTKGFQIDGEVFPALTNADIEGRSVARLSNSHLYEADAFSAKNLMQAMSDGTGVVHIISHFRFRPGDEDRSYLVLGDGKPLSLARFNREFPQTDVKLLVLSACDTAIGGEADGSEFEGFARRAQEKGAGAVIATLWPVADRSTSLLMSEFYRLHAAHPAMAKMEALREAQLSLLRGAIGSAKGTGARRSAAANGAGGAPASFKTDPRRPYAHPFYWAPFVLFGNWR